MGCASPNRTRGLAPLAHGLKLPSSTDKPTGFVGDYETNRLLALSAGADGAAHQRDGRGHRGTGMKHPQTRELFDYWRSLQQGDRLPDRQDIDPQEFKHALSFVFMLQRIDTDHYIFRLAGTGLCNCFGREFRDHNFLTLWTNKDRRAMKALLEQSVLSSQAAYAGFDAETVDRRICAGELLLLPLRNGDGRKDRILGLWQALAELKEFRGRRFVHHHLSNVLMLTDNALTYKPVVADSLLKGTAPPYLRLVHSSSEVA